MTNEIAARQPKGIPTGGQFASTSHPEATITLPARVNLGAYNRTFASAPAYRKNAIVEARITERQERLATVLADGTVETERIVPPGHYVVTNPGGEQYAIDAEKFAKKYTPMEDGRWRARGEIRAFQSPVLGPITVMAPWGEEQYGAEGCYLAASVDDEGNPTEDRYIIGEQEFLDTYEAID